MNETTKRLRYSIYPMTDYPHNAVGVQVEVRRVGAYWKGNMVTLIRANGLIFNPAKHGYRDVRDSPELFGAFGALTGIKQTELRQARKEWLAEKDKTLHTERVESARDEARALGYRLVKLDPR